MVDGFSFSYPDFVLSILLSCQEKESPFAEAIIISLCQMSHHASIVFYIDCILISRIFWFHSSTRTSSLTGFQISL